MNTETTESTAIAIFARAPVPGFAKTRLIPSLGPEMAANLQRAFILRTLQTTLAARLGPVYLYCTPDCAHPLFQQCRNDYDITLCPQNEGDLGERMFATFSTLFMDDSESKAAYDCPHPGPLPRGDGVLCFTSKAPDTLDAVLLIGTDCPALTCDHLRMAASALREGEDAVFLPAEDGGYVLVGLRRAEARLFTDMPWGSAEVMAETRRRLLQCSMHWREPVLLWDVDGPEDIARLRSSGLMDEWFSEHLLADFIHEQLDQASGGGVATLASVLSKEERMAHTFSAFRRLGLA